MQTHPAKRAEIITKEIMERRLTEALLKADVAGFCVLTAKGGSGRSSHWSRAGRGGRADCMA